LGRDQDQHVDMICLQMPFDDFALFLTGKLMEDFTKVLLQLPV
jgi:hypothetical protein